MFQVAFVLATECVGASKRAFLGAVYPGIFAVGKDNWPINFTEVGSKFKRCLLHLT